jgi:sarcosine oxidase, subunit alpha
MMYRLPEAADDWIDRSQRVEFTFEGEQRSGFVGDCVTSALAAAGVMVLGRSFKYHRPRGILSFANHDVNTLFEVDGVPNVRGDVTPVRNGQRVMAVNTFGGLRRDRARLLDRLAPFLPVGFYYKAFHSKRHFPRWERLIRRLSGLGAISVDAPRQVTPKRYAFCDVLVVGGGPSGLGAALAAAHSGARVLLIDENPRLGGCGRWSGAPHGALAQLIREVTTHSRIEVICSSFAAGYYADHLVALVEPTRMTKVRARAIVFATGVCEQPAVFRNNDLPGVMLGSAAQRLLHRYGIAPGRRVVVVAANREAYELCGDLLANHVEVVALADLRPEGEPDAAAVALLRGRVPVRNGHAPLEARPDGDGCLRAIRLAAAGRTEDIACDALLMSVGFAPAFALLAQSGARIEFDEALQQHVPAQLPDGIFAAGRLNGVYDYEARVADGRTAGGAAAASACGEKSLDAPPAARSARRPSHAFPIFDHPRAGNFVDFDEDLQVKDLRGAMQEGFDSIELLKRFSTVGMGPSQGKHSNLHAARILARHRGDGVGAAGLTTARPMFHPVPLKHLAGRGFQPERRTPIEDRHAAAGAVWMSAGNWQRPEYYRVEGQSRAQCIAAEASAVREALGIIDVGTLGKIEIHGPDAGAMLDRVYAGSYSNLRVGMTRYGLMLDEVGTIVDDGVIARLGDERFYFTTTTGGSASVFRELLRWNAQWGLDCALVNVTGHMAAFNLAGPRSRDVLATQTDIDLSEAAFPYLGVREGRVAGARARLMRVGFVGELGYEIHVPYEDAGPVWDAVLSAGRSAGLRPFGVEAQRMLRLEKGHLIVAQDTDGLTNPFEAQAGWAVRMQKPFFVGQRSLRMLQARGSRQTLIGFELSGSAALKESHLVIDGADIAGRITSVVRSATLGRTIGLAMVRPDLATPGNALSIRVDDGSLVAATIVPTPFYDRDGLRQK